MWLTARARSGTWPICVLVLVLLGAVPILPISDALLFEFFIALVYAIAAVGMDLISGYGGQLSVGQFAFVGVGAYTFAILRNSYGLEVVPAMLLAALGSAALAGAVGVCLLQLRHIGAAIGTFFLAFVVASALGGQLFSPLTQGDNGIRVSSVVLGGWDLSQGLPLYVTAWALLTVVVGLALVYANSRLGLELRLVKHSEIVSSVLGLNVLRAKLMAFVTAALFAAFGGVILAIGLGYLAPETFRGDESVNVFAMVVVGGMGSIAGPVIGAVFFILIQTLLQATGAAREVVFASALLVALILFPEGLYSGVESLLYGTWRRVMRRARRPADEDEPSSIRFKLSHDGVGASVPLAGEDHEHLATLLRVEGLRVDFGGSHALDGVSLSVAESNIHSVVGPNGAGKTTLLNCLSGIQRPVGGSIWLDNSNIARLSPQRRCGLGFARTFQHPALVPDLTIEENIRLGAYAAGLSNRKSSTGGADRVADRVSWAMELTGIPSGLAGRLAKDVSYRDQKVIDLARALALRPRVLLLDEPDSGLDEREVAGLVGLLKDVHRQIRLTIILISHHVGVVLDVADWVSVLDAGRVVADGPPQEVLTDQEVVNVFIGERTGARGLVTG